MVLSLNFNFQIKPLATHPDPAMHRFHSKSTILRFRFAALLLCLQCLLVPLAAGVLMHAIIIGDRQRTFIAIGLGALAILVVILQWLVAARARCPLCMTSVMATKGCAKHRNARTIFGSHRLRVALAILFKGSFLCPYCHESSAMEVRARHGLKPSANPRD